jgi:hypothetical protein
MTVQHDTRSQNGLLTRAQVKLHQQVLVRKGKGKGKGKGKAVLLQAWSGPEGCRKLRFPDFVTTAQDGGKVVSLMHRPPLPPGDTPSTHSC